MHHSPPLFCWRLGSFFSSHILVMKYLLLCKHISHILQISLPAFSSSSLRPLRPLPLNPRHEQTMGKTQRNQQASLWEFVHTELTYINKLKIIKDVRCPPSLSMPSLLLSSALCVRAEEEVNKCVCLPLTVGDRSSPQAAPA